MNADQVARQARMIHGRVVPMREYLFTPQQRMAKRGFSRGDPLFDLVVNAQQPVGELYVDVEYRMNVGPVELPPSGYHCSVGPLVGTGGWLIE